MLHKDSMEWVLYYALSLIEHAKPLMNTSTLVTPISAVVITLNEENNIAQCLDSLHFCSEIIVVDSHSTDNTVAIAQQKGAKVIQQRWLGFGPQKNFAVSQAENDWVLCIDADEQVSPELARSIQQTALLTEQCAAYQFPRRNHFLGRPLKHGEGYPDLSLRLFHREHAQWSQDIVHEGVKSQGQVSTLSGDLLHYSEDTIASYLQKQNRYTSLQAQILFDKGKRVNSVKCITSPFFRFIKFYFLRLGLLDGSPGLIHITIGCINAFCKYAKLIELQKTSQRQS